MVEKTRASVYPLALFARFMSPSLFIFIRNSLTGLPCPCHTATQAGSVSPLFCLLPGVWGSIASGGAAIRTGNCSSERRIRTNCAPSCNAGQPENGIVPDTEQGAATVSRAGGASSAQTALSGARVSPAGCPDFAVSISRKASPKLTGVPRSLRFFVFSLMTSFTKRPGHCANFVESSGGVRGSIGSVHVPLKQKRSHQFHQFQKNRNTVKPCDI